MNSNEHLDMSGNWADEPLRCEVCGDPVAEDKAFGDGLDPELIFCSANCVEDWNESQIDSRYNAQ